MSEQYARAPVYMIKLAGKEQGEDLTQRVQSFRFHDYEDKMDMLEITLDDSDLHLMNNDLIAEGVEIEFKFGYLGAMSETHICTIKEVEPAFGDTVTIGVKAYDKGFSMSGKDVQKAWAKEAPGMSASDIAREIAKKHGLKPVVEDTDGKTLSTQQTTSDAKFLLNLAKDARPASGKECAGYAFYIEGNELHFHPPFVDTAPTHSFIYYLRKPGEDARGNLLAFKPKPNTQGAKGAGTETKALGVDPAAGLAKESVANNEATPDRPVLGSKTLFVDGGSGEKKFDPQTETGKVVSDPTAMASRTETPKRDPGKDKADAKFKAAEGLQLEGSATVEGDASIKAKRNVQIVVEGVPKYTGTWYLKEVVHSIGDGGYTCELGMKKNAIGKRSPAQPKDSKGQENKQEAKPESPKMVTVNAATGQVEGAA